MNKTTTYANIIIADTQVLIVEGLKALFNNAAESGKPVNIRSVSSKAELSDAVKETNPSAIIVDHCLIDFDGIHDLKQIKESSPETSIIILTSHLTRSEIVEFHKIGVNNILHKALEKEELFECLDAAKKGKKYYSGYVLDLLMESGEKKVTVGGPVQLTASEIDIVRLIAEGLTNREIAEKKFLSIHTIMTHRKNILRKLGASNASEMIMFAIKAGIIDNIEYHI